MCRNVFGVYCNVVLRMWSDVPRVRNMASVHQLIGTSDKLLIVLSFYVWIWLPPETLAETLSSWCPITEAWIYSQASSCWSCGQHVVAVE